MPKKTNPDQEARLIGGSALIVLGIIFIMNIAFGWDVMWPLFIVFPGVIVIISYLVTGQDTEGTIISSAILFSLASFFLLFTIGILKWDDMSWLWPGFLLMPGLGLLASYFYSGEKEQLIPALILITLFSIFTFGSFYDLWIYWPIILIVLGSVIIVFDRIK